MTKTNTPEIYTNPTQKSIKDLSFKLTVGRSSGRVSGHGHSKTESELTELTIYISMADYSLADSVIFCLFLELFFFPVLPIILFRKLFENNRLRPNRYELQPHSHVQNNRAP